MEALNAFVELKELLEQKAYSNEGCLNFLDEDELFDRNYTRQQATQIQQAFVQLAKAYLTEHYPGQFIIFSDWCVHIATTFYGEHYLSNTRPYVICQ